MSASGTRSEPPVCVLGMHRSGTSITARILNLLGVDLGPEEQMFDPLPGYNPKGFWEQRRVTGLNDEILRSLGGTWWRPPPLPEGWEASPALEPLKAKGRRIIDELFGGSRRWGFKDPRACLTLPFWWALVPEMSFVICLRSPAAVASSLFAHRPDRHPRLDTGTLWLRYYADAIEHTAGAPRTFVSFESYFEGHEAEIDRLAGVVGLDADALEPAAEAEIDSFLDAELWHHGPADEEAADRDAMAETFHLLLRALAEDGDPGRSSPLRDGELELAVLELAKRLRREPDTRPSRLPRSSRSLPSALCRFEGGVDRPLDGETHPRAPLRVEGWALDRGGPVGKVEIFLNGRSVGLARLGIPRPDVAEAVDAPAGALAGFERLIDVGDVPANSSVLDVRVAVEGLDGDREILGGATLRLTDEQPEARAARSGVERRRRRTAEVIDRARPEPGRLPATAIRLLVFTHDLGIGGGQLYLLELLSRLVGNAELSCSVVSATGGPLEERLEAIGVPVHVTAGYPHDGEERYEGKLAELGAWAAPQDFNVALVNTFGAFLGGDLAGRLGIPAVWAIHESWDLPTYLTMAHSVTPAHSYVRRRAALALSEASAVLFVADATRRQWAPYASPAPLITADYGVELEAIDAYRRGFDRRATRARLSIPPNATVILCLGTIEPRKAQSVVAEAFAGLAGEHPDSSLILVGSLDDEHSRGIVDFVERAGLRDRVRLVPLARDPLQWFGVADVFVCASDVESMPRVVLEAMAFELPVIATRIFGLPELIDDGRTGYLCEARDLAALIACLRRVLAEDPARRRDVGAAGANVVRARHAREPYASRFVRLLSGLVADPSAPSTAFLEAERSPSHVAGER